MLSSNKAFFRMLLAASCPEICGASDASSTTWKRQQALTIMC
jgi:hypothetical protein